MTKEQSLEKKIEKILNNYRKSCYLACEYPDSVSATESQMIANIKVHSSILEAIDSRLPKEKHVVFKDENGLVSSSPSRAVEFDGYNDCLADVRKALGL